MMYYNGSLFGIIGVILVILFIPCTLLLTKMISKHLSLHLISWAGYIFRNYLVYIFKLFSFNFGMFNTILLIFFIIKT